MRFGIPAPVLRPAGRNRAFGKGDTVRLLLSAERFGGSVPVPEALADRPCETTRKSVETLAFEAIFERFFHSRSTNDML